MKEVAEWGQSIVIPTVLLPFIILVQRFVHEIVVEGWQPTPLADRLGK